MRTGLLTRIVHVTLLGLALAARARAADAPPLADVPVGFPIQMDGRMTPAEWSDAAVFPLGTDGATLKVKQFRGTLLLGVEINGPWPQASHLTLYVCPDVEGASALEPGAASLDYEPLDHSRRHLRVQRHLSQGDQEFAGHALARGDVHGARATVEMAIRLEMLGVTERASGPKRLAVVLARPDAGRTATWPEGLDMGARSGGPPPDFASSERWGRLRGWKDPEGPGAFSKTEWDTLLAFDDEITRRGGQAHGHYLEIDEEAEHLEKRDIVLVPELVENFRWIAEREPLSVEDLVALSRGYRFLNRKGEALGVLEGLSGMRDRHFFGTIGADKAKLLESMERYEEASALWAFLAQTATGLVKARYEAGARETTRAAEARKAERETCAAEDARGDLPLVLLRTSRGDVLVTLFQDDVPKAVEHFLSLADLVDARTGKRFYDGTMFHRVIGDFRAEGGDPKSRDEGCEAAGSGESPTTIEIEKNARHAFWRGSVGFARGMKPVNGSQFFVLTSPRPGFAAEGVTCFGRVVAGMEAVDRLEHCDRLLSVEVVRPAKSRPDDGK